MRPEAWLEHFEYGIITTRAYDDKMWKIIAFVKRVQLRLHDFTINCYTTVKLLSWKKCPTSFAVIFPTNPFYIALFCDIIDIEEGLNLMFCFLHYQDRIIHLVLFSGPWAAAFFFNVCILCNGTESLALMILRAVVNWWKRLGDWLYGRSISISHST